MKIRHIRELQGAHGLRGYERPYCCPCAKTLVLIYDAVERRKQFSAAWCCMT